MVTVKLFGLFRLDSSIKEMQVEAKNVKELFPLVVAEAKRINPKTTVTEKSLNGCVIVINGKQCKKNASLKDGDSVMLMSPVCGG